MKNYNHTFMPLYLVNLLDFGNCKIEYFNRVEQIIDGPFKHWLLSYAKYNDSNYENREKFRTLSTVFLKSVKDPAIYLSYQLIK